MAVGEAFSQHPSAPLALAAQTRGDRATFFAGGQIKGLSAAWTRSWQLLDSTLWSCWLVTELFSSSLQESKVEQGERARSPSPHVRLRAADLCISHRRGPQVEVDMLSTFDGLPLQAEISLCAR